MALGSGMWAIMFTDVVGSTGQRARIGDAVADDLRREHDAVVASACAARGGQVVKGTGDGSMVAFAGAADAVSAAIAIQQGIELRNRQGAEHLSLRIGISLGDLAHEDGDLFGLAVNEAARLCALADADEVLLSDIVRIVAGSRIGHRLEDRGANDLKGMPEPVRVWAAIWEPDEAARPLPFPSFEFSSDAMAFTGRASELGVLTDEWNRAAAGSRRAVLVSGEPGVGKTRLVAELARRAYDQGALVVYGRCDDESGVAFQPFAEAIDWYFGNVEVPVPGSAPRELCRLSLRVAEMHSAVSEPTREDAETAQYRLFDAVTSWIVALAGDQPMVMVLDDLHWASQPTLLLLRHVLRHVAESPLLIVGTYRDSDLDLQTSLGAMLPDFGRLPSVRRQVLSGLDRDEVGELLARVIGQPLNDQEHALSEALHAETGGNAFFIGEVLEHLADVGAWVRGDRGGIRTDLAARVGIPPGVRELVGQRLNQLGTDVTEILRSAAILGRDFDARLVCEISPEADNAVVDALDRAAGANLVQDIGRGAYRFAHALIRTTLLEGLSTARRMRLHRDAALAFEATRPDDLGRIAFHWVEAAMVGEPRRAVEACRRAAARASASAAFGDGVALLQRAADLAAEADLDPGTRARLLLDLGDARMAAGEIETARDAYALAVETDDDVEILITAALAFHGPPRIETVDPRYADLMRRAIGAIDPERSPEIAAQLHATLALKLEDRDDDRGLHVARSAELGGTSEDPRTQILIHQNRFWAGFSPDGEAVQEADAVLRAARQLGSPSEVLAALQLCVIAVAQRDGPAATAGLIEEHRQLADTTGLQYFRDFQAGIDSRSLLIAGEHEAAMALMQRTVDETPSSSNLLTWATVNAQCLWLRDLGEDLAETVGAWVEGGMVPTEVQVYVEAGLARALADSNRPDEAQAAFDRIVADGFARLTPIGANGLPAELAVLAEVCAALGDSVNAAELLARLEPWRGSHLQLTLGEYCGPATLAIGRVERTMRRFDRAAQSLERAIAEADRADAPVKGTEAKLELAATLSERRGPDDLPRVRQLVGDVLGFAQPHGLVRLSRRAKALTPAST